MKKTTIISLAILTLIIAAIVFVLISKEADAPPVNETSQSAGANNKQNREQDKLQTGQYTPYDEAKLASSKGENYLFFHAPWCPQCQSIEASIDAGGDIPNGVTIFKVDYDTNQELREKYGVTVQTTFVKVDNQGNLIDKYVAYDKPTIDSVVENFISK